VRSGRLAPGTRLPSTRDLAAQLGLSRGTVTQAYEQLEVEGWLTGRSGSGTRVAGDASQPQANRTADDCARAPNHAMTCDPATPTAVPSPARHGAARCGGRSGRRPRTRSSLATPGDG